MENTGLLVYMLYGIGGIGVLMALLVLITAVIQRGLERKADRIDEAEHTVPDAKDEDEADVPAQDAQEMKYDAGVDGPLGVSPDGVAMAAKRTAAAGDIATRAKNTASGRREKTVRDGADSPEEDATRGAPAMIDGLDSEDTVSVTIGGFTVRAYAAQHIGARKEQQDALHHTPVDGETIQKTGFLYIVCDGMGGMKMGGEAARLAAGTFASAFLASKLPPQQALREAADIANGVVWELCRSEEQLGAGTTLVAALVTEEGMHYLSVGDSHIYLLRGGVLSQLNADHNYLSELLLKVRRGEITREQALSDPERAHLTSYLGLRRLTQVDRSSGPIEMEDGDKILLASDGLFKVLTPAGIADRLQSLDEKTVPRLIQDVLSFQYRNQDNVSVALIALNKAGESAQTASTRNDEVRE